MTFWKRQNIRMKNRPMFARGWGQWKGWVQRSSTRVGNGIVMYPD